MSVTLSLQVPVLVWSGHPVWTGGRLEPDNRSWPNLVPLTCLIQRLGSFQNCVLYIFVFSLLVFWKFLTSKKKEPPHVPPLCRVDVSQWYVHQGHDPHKCTVSSTHCQNKFPKLSIILPRVSIGSLKTFPKTSVTTLCSANLSNWVPPPRTLNFHTLCLT